MLTWTKEADGWHAQGYVIRLVEPFRWALLPDTEPADEDAVSLISEPLATTRTLTECKREAELRAAAVRRSASVRRSTAQLLLAACGLVFTLGSPPPWSFFLSLGLVYVAARSISFMIGLFAARYGQPPGGAFYQ